MASQDESSHRGVGGREDPLSASGRHHNIASELQYPPSPGFCALCFLTLGSREKRVSWGKGSAHPSCVAKLRRQEAA